MYTYKVLLIEDNPFFLQLWNLILSQSVHSHKLDWAVSEKAAAKLINEHYYDIVISDIFLSGSKTGVDIWRTINPEACTFIFASSIEKNSFEEFVTEEEERPYLFLEKPLDVDKCINCISEITLAGPGLKYA
ncbi:hypothetical protein CIK05_04915 [Bdellovibrio sp. qaytius]|nr:hypothetical protein CIK05_04915 [Bdellovibrio sp. qaytius]